MNDLAALQHFTPFTVRTSGVIKASSLMKQRETPLKNYEKHWNSPIQKAQIDPNHSKSSYINEEPSSIFSCVEGAASCRHLSNELSVRTQHSSEIDSNSPKDCWLDWANDNHASILYLALALLVACDKTQRSRPLGSAMMQLATASSSSSSWHHACGSGTSSLKTFLGQQMWRLACNTSGACDDKFQLHIYQLIILVYQLRFHQVDALHLNIRKKLMTKMNMASYRLLNSIFSKRLWSHCGPIAVLLPVLCRLGQLFLGSLILCLNIQKIWAWTSFKTQCCTKHKQDPILDSLTQWNPLLLICTSHP